MKIVYNTKSIRTFFRASSFCAAASVFLLAASNLGAVPHVNGRDMGPKEYVHRNQKVSAGEGAYAISKTIATTGTRRVAVILVDFQTPGSATSAPLQRPRVAG